MVDAEGFSLDMMYSPFMFVTGAVFLLTVGEHCAREKQIPDNSKILMVSVTLILACFTGGTVICCLYLFVFVQVILGMLGDE